MSEPTTNVLSSFSATSAKGSDLLAGISLKGGDANPETAGSFSKALSQAQQDAEATPVAERTNSKPTSTADVDSTANPSMLARRGAVPAEAQVNSGKIVRSRPMGDVRETVDSTGPSAAGVSLALGSEVSDLDGATLATTNVPDSLLTVPLDASVISDEVKNSQGLAVSVMPGDAQEGILEQPASIVDVAITNDQSLNSVAQKSDVLVASLESPLQSANASLATAQSAAVSLTAAADTVVATTLGSTSSSTGPSLQNSLSVDEALTGGVVSIATLANRLNVSSDETIAQIAPQGAKPADAEQLTTIAGIQSVQLGMAGVNQPKVAAADSEITLGRVIPSADNAAAVSISATQVGKGILNDGAETLALNQTALADQTVLPMAAAKESISGASIVPSRVANELPATAQGPQVALSGPLLDQPTGVNLNPSAAGMAVVSEATPNVSINPLLDNMLSVPASGTVTAPILVKADMTGTPTVSTPLNVPLLTPAATEAMAGNVKWMVGEGVQNAIVNVTPNGMGPISVQIGIEKEQMSISIVASQSTTRDALEALVPRLRDQLGAQGVDAVRVDISDGRGERSGNFNGSERQNLAYTQSNNDQGSQQRNADNQNNDRSSSDNAGTTNESGERVLSDSERALVDQLKNSSTNLSVKNASIRHGYDLYV